MGAIHYFFLSAGALGHNFDCLTKLQLNLKKKHNRTFISNLIQRKIKMKTMYVINSGDI